MLKAYLSPHPHWPGHFALHDEAAADVKALWESFRSGTVRQDLITAMPHMADLPSVLRSGEPWTGRDRTTVDGFLLHHAAALISTQKACLWELERISTSSQQWRHRNDEHPRFKEWEDFNNFS